MPNEIREGIGKELEGKMDFLFDKLAVQNTKDAVNKTVEQVAIKPNLQGEVSAAS